MSYALVTGGSSGIGFAYAEEMASRGYNILIVSNREDLNLECQQLLQNKYPVRIETLYQNLAIPDAAQQVYDYCHAHDMEVEVLINNAGMFYFKTAVETPVPLENTMLQLHVTTPTLLCTLFGKDMKERRKGYILNAASICGYMSFPMIVTYESTKRYVRNFSRGLAFELSDYGVKVCCVSPGAVDTDLYHLNKKLRRRLCRWGIMLTPVQVTKRGVRALFRGRKSIVTGGINYFFLCLVALVPNFVVDIVKRKYISLF